VRRKGSGPSGPCAILAHGRGPGQRRREPRDWRGVIGDPGAKLLYFALPVNADRAFGAARNRAMRSALGAVIAIVAVIAALSAPREATAAPGKW
jgi:hypothetical protein